MDVVSLASLGTTGEAWMGAMLRLGGAVRSGRMRLAGLELSGARRGVCRCDEPDGPAAVATSLSVLDGGAENAVRIRSKSDVNANEDGRSSLSSSKLSDTNSFVMGWVVGPSLAMPVVSHGQIARGP